MYKIISKLLKIFNNIYNKGVNKNIGGDIDDWLGDIELKRISDLYYQE